MKKTLLTVMVLTMLILTMSIASFAVTSTASYATTAPVIDGVIDPIWDTTETQNYVGTGDDWVEGDVTAYSKILWDENFMYYLIVVKDTTVGTSFASQANDAINFWISENNTKADSLAEDIGDYMYMITSTGHTLHDIGNAAGIEYNIAVYSSSLLGFVKTDDGYIAELKQPYISGLKPSVGHILGYTFSVNDDSDDDAVRDAYCYSARDVENGGSESWYWSKTVALGEVEFVDAPVAEPEPIAPDAEFVDPEPAPVVDPTPANPTTSDVTAIFYVLAAASAVCTGMLSKKR